MLLGFTTVALLSAAVVLADPAEVESEWKPLFNGKDLSGWKAIDGPQESWRVEDGVVFCTGDGAGWLSTEAEYGNFEIELEFRVPPGGNSGVFLRAPHEGNPAYQGLEIQVLDDHAEVYADLRPTQYTGSVYGLVAASPRVTGKAAEWQRMRILCDGAHVVVTLNGTKIVDADLAQYLNRADEHPGLKRTRGHIGLQNHGSRLDYRNVRIRELP